jgi:hypothetical protein
VDRKGTVWLVKLECRLSEEDRKRLLKQPKKEKAALGLEITSDSFGLRNAKPLGEQQHAAGAGSD